MKVQKAAQSWLFAEKNKLALLRGGWHRILAWPLAGIAIFTVAWNIAYNKLDFEEQEVRRQTYSTAQALSSMYAKQMESAFQKIDELSTYITYTWEKSQGALKFEELLARGHFGVDNFSSFMFVAPNGIPISSTIAPPPGLNFSDREYFKHHKKNASKNMFVGVPTVGKLSGKRLIPLTRRVDHPDGSFAGVVVIGMPLDFFSPFSDESLFGKSGLLALIGHDMRVRVTSVGGETGRAEQVSLQKVPEFSMPAHILATKSGNWAPRTMDGSWFSDNKPRIAATAWLDNYPFRAFVGLSEEESLQPYLKKRAEIIHAGIVASLILAFFIIVAMLLSARLVLRKAEEVQSRKAYRIATDGGNEGFYLWYPIRDSAGSINDFRVVDCNERGAELYGMTKAEMMGQTVFDIYPTSYSQELMNIFREAQEVGFLQTEHRVSKQSRIVVNWVHKKIVKTGDGLAVTIRDVSQIHEQEEELTRQATKDSLTGLPNRYWLTTDLPKLLTEASQNNSSVALLFIDLDDFKNVNDSLGHAAGDALLKEAAARLSSLVRPTDTVVRLGGDEFTVVLRTVTSHEIVAEVAARIVSAFKEPFHIENRNNFVGTSIGISIFPKDALDADALLVNADLAMYSAKGSKGAFCFFDSKLYDRFRKRLDTEQELQCALDEDQFILHYQPRADTHTGAIVGLEALVRWMHPVRGMVFPGDFISVAESTGLILTLGNLVLIKTCAQLADWRAQGLPIVPVSVNVSALQFNEGTVQEIIISCLEKYNLPPEMLELELTESTMMQEGTDILEQLAAIDKMGIKVHVDDFGTGYSSLALLQRLKLDVLKIDRAFTSKLGESEDGEIFFKTIVSMAHALGMSVVAEGIETAAQLRILQRLGCNEVQGFYLSKPVPAAQVPALLVSLTLFPQEPTVSNPVSVLNCR